MGTSQRKSSRNAWERFFVSGFFVSVFLLCNPVVKADGIDDVSKFDPSKLKANVLYINLANPSEARGISLADEKGSTSIKHEELGEETAAVSEDGYFTVKLDPAAVKPETLMLVAFNYYDSEWNEPYMQGLMCQPDKKGFYTSNKTNAGAYSESWRWWTTLTYANYFKTVAFQGKQASFRIKVKGIRWILVLPLTEETTAQVKAIREKVLAMLADYADLLIANAALQENRNRMEQAMKYLSSGSEEPEMLEKIFKEIKDSAWQSRIEMDKVIMEVLQFTGPVYLGVFDGEDAMRLKAMEDFRQKVLQLTKLYQGLCAKAEKCLDKLIDAQNEKYGLKKVSLQAPEKLSAEHIVKAEDVRSRFFLGLVRQVPLLTLPQSSIDSITKEQGIDSVYEYSLSNYVKPEENGTYDFSDLDKLLGKMKGLRVELGLHNIPLPTGWAQKKFFGDKPDILSTGRKYYDYYRVKNTNGQWDGFCMWDPNSPRSFTPASTPWSDSLFHYACDFYRAIGKHFRNDPAILRYTLNSETTAVQSVETGFIWDSALPYYRKYLEKKFGDIGKLNQVFGCKYQNFNEIPLPKPAEGEKTARLTAAWYEYTQMCIERTKYIREEFARVLKEADPNHVIGECASTLYGGNAIDSYTMTSNTPYDTFAAGDSDTRAVRYQYSLNRFNPKPIWLYEPYTYWSWTAPEGKGYRVEETTRRMLMSNLWTWFAWGHQGLPFFNHREVPGRTDVTDYRIADIMLWSSESAWQQQQANPVLRPAAASLAVLKPVYEKLEKILCTAAVVPAKIGLLESSTTHRVQWPRRGTFSDLSALQWRLEKEKKHFFFVPETGIVDGAEKLASYRVIIAAYATHLKPEAKEKLLEWVKNGGVLICSGPTGLFDQYGRSEGNLPETVFGMKGIKYGADQLNEDGKVVKCAGAMSGKEGISLWASKDFYWHLPSKDLSEGTQILAMLPDGSPVAAERNYGKGKVIITATSIGNLPDLYWPMVMKEIENAQPVPEAASSSPDLALQVRENNDGIRYLCVISRNISSPVEAAITVAGEFEHPRDLTIGNGWVIPAKAGGGVTSFKIWLAPGMGSFIELGKSKTKLSGLSPEEENAQLDLGRYSNLLRRASAWGLDISAEKDTLKKIEKNSKDGSYAEVREHLAEMTEALYERWFKEWAKRIEVKRSAPEVNPQASSFARSYAAIALALLKEGKPDLAEERMAYAEKILPSTPENYPAEITFPFISDRLDLGNFSDWPQKGWQKVYSDRTAKSGELGQFIIVGSPEGIYLGAKVKTEKITDKSQSAGLAWRVMDGVILNLRCLDRTKELSSEFRSEDTYEITFYSDGSVFVWDNLLPCNATLIRNKVTRVNDGYWIGGFIPAEAVRFWPQPGATVIMDLCMFKYMNRKSHDNGYWHGKYAQPATWARVRLGETIDKSKVAKSIDPSTTEAYLKIERWMPQESREAGRAKVSFDANEKLPDGRKGAIVLSNDGNDNAVQLMTRFKEIGKRPGLKVWLKGEGSGAEIELRVTSRDGYTWQYIVQDDVKGWRAVDVFLDKCKQVYEENHAEVLGGFFKYRPELNSLIVRFSKPLTSIKVGRIEYLEDKKL